MAIKVEVFSTNSCPHCPSAIEAAQVAKDKLGDAIDVEVIKIDENSENRQRAIDYQIEVISGRTGTNADEVITSGDGVPAAIISIPLRYMHSAGEVVSLEDMQSTMRLLLGYITQRGGAF